MKCIKNTLSFGICLIFPVIIHMMNLLNDDIRLTFLPYKLGILYSLVLGFIVGIYVVLMKAMPRKQRIMIAAIHSLWIVGLFSYYVFYNYFSIEFKRATVTLYKLFVDSRYELYFFGGISILMLGRWKEKELCPYQTSRMMVLFCVPFLIIGLYYLHNATWISLTNEVRTFLYHFFFIVWGLLVGTYAWMTNRLNEKNRRLLYTLHIILFGVIVSILGIFSLTEYTYTHFLRSFGYLSLCLVLFEKNQHQFISNSQTSAMINV